MGGESESVQQNQVGRRDKIQRLVAKSSDRESVKKLRLAHGRNEQREGEIEENEIEFRKSLDRFNWTISLSSRKL